MSTLGELHERWSRDPDYREAYEQLAPECEVARALIEARTRAGLTQAESGHANEDDAVGGRAVGERAHTTVHADAGEGCAGNGDSAADPVRQHPVKAVPIYRTDGTGPTGSRMADLAILLELSSAAIALLGGSLRLRRVDLAVFGGARLAGAEPERRTGQTAVTEP